MEIVVAGHTIPIRTPASQEEVEAAAKLVEERLETITNRNAPLSHQTLLLVAMNLANEILTKQKENQLFKETIQHKSKALLHDLELSAPSTE